MKIFGSKSFAIRQLGCSVLFIAFCIAMLFTMVSDTAWTQSPRGWFFFVCMALGLPLFGVGLVMSFKKLFDKRPFLEVDEKGISTTYGGYGSMSWRDISMVRMAEFQASLTTKVKYLVLVPKNPEAFVASLDVKTKKRAANAMKQWGGIIIPLVGLPFKPDDIAGAIGEYGSQMILTNAAAPPVIR